MNKFRNFLKAVGVIIFVPALMIFALPVALSAAAIPIPGCGGDARCEKQKSILRRLEKAKPTKKMTKQQIFRQIKSACDKMRSLDCPDIRNYKPNICFTDF